MVLCNKHKELSGSEYFNSRFIESDTYVGKCRKIRYVKNRYKNVDNIMHRQCIVCSTGDCNLLCCYKMHDNSQ